MAHAVLIQNPDSIYKDEPGLRYHFPKMYLRALQDCVDDWVIFYEGKKGALGYTSVQRVTGIRADIDLEGHFFADLDPGSRWQFERVVPRTDSDGRPYETMLRRLDGTPIRGGANTLAVRRLSPGDFSVIVQAGIAPSDGALTLERDPKPSEHQDVPGFADGPTPFSFDAPLSGFRKDVLTSRPHRDASFARMVKAAYGGRCAISGLALRNGGGRSEVEAAHIRPVAKEGPDIVQNGLALSGTLHWMFDRGLISVAEDHRILVAHNKVDPETARRLIVPDMRLRLPDNPRDHPHPSYLQFHREVVYGGLG